MSIILTTKWTVFFVNVLVLTVLVYRFDVLQRVCLMTDSTRLLLTARFEVVNED